MRALLATAVFTIVTFVANALAVLARSMTIT